MSTVTTYHPLPGSTVSSQVCFLSPWLVAHPINTKHPQNFLGLFALCSNTKPRAEIPLVCLSLFSFCATCCSTKQHRQNASQRTSGCKMTSTWRGQNRIRNWLHMSILQGRSIVGISVFPGNEAGLAGSSGLLSVCSHKHTDKFLVTYRNQFLQPASCFKTKGVPKVTGLSNRLHAPPTLWLCFHGSKGF